MRSQLFATATGGRSNFARICRNTESHKTLKQREKTSPCLRRTQGNFEKYVRDNAKANAGAYHPDAVVIHLHRLNLDKSAVGTVGYTTQDMIGIIRAHPRGHRATDDPKVVKASPVMNEAGIIMIED